MTTKISKSAAASRSTRVPVARLLAAGLLALTASGCRTLEEGTRVAGWELTDPLQRHPILVSQQPETMTVDVPRGSRGLSPAQRADIMSFAGMARATDAGNTRLVISAPSGSANEVAALAAVHEIGDVFRDSGFAESSLAVEPFDAEGRSNPPVRISFLRYVAEGPECGYWPTNLAREPRNLPMANIGCASQKNLAAMVVNPADLLGPRGMDSRPAERRLVTWDKYIKGESTGAEKSTDERVQTQD